MQGSRVQFLVRELRKVLLKKQKQASKQTKKPLKKIQALQMCMKQP